MSRDFTAWKADLTEYFQLLRRNYEKLEKSVLKDRPGMDRSVSLSFHYFDLLFLSDNQQNQMHLQGVDRTFLNQLTMPSTIKKFTANRLYLPAKLFIPLKSCMINPTGYVTTKEERAR